MIVTSDIVTWSTLSLSSLAMSLKMLTSWVQRESRKLCTEREAGRIGEDEVGIGGEWGG